MRIVPDRTAEIEAAEKRVRAYADAIRAGETKLDQQSLDRAEDLATLYESKIWLAEVEPPKNKIYRGRPVDPESRNRFLGWTLTRFGLGPRYGRMLLTAHDWRANYGNTVPLNRIAGEGTLRPTYALQRKGYGDRTPEVMRRAQELADERGSDRIESSDVRQAVSEFFAEIPKGQVRRSTLDAQARSHATKIRSEAQWLVEHGYLHTLAELLTELDKLGEQASSRTVAAS